MKSTLGLKEEKKNLPCNFNLFKINQINKRHYVD